MQHDKLSRGEDSTSPRWWDTEDLLLNIDESIQTGETPVMKELKIKRPYGQSNAELVTRAKDLGGWHRSTGNYRRERYYIDTYIVPRHVTEAMLKGGTTAKA